jgi:hypothetical protein
LYDSLARYAEILNQKPTMRIIARNLTCVGFVKFITEKDIGRKIVRLLKTFYKQQGGITHSAGGRILDGSEWNEIPPEFPGGANKLCKS